MSVFFIITLRARKPVKARYNYNTVQCRLYNQAQLRPAGTRRGKKKVKAVLSDICQRTGKQAGNAFQAGLCSALVEVGPLINAVLQQCFFDVTQW